MREVTFHIQGMHCGACVRRLSAALARLPHVSVRDVVVGRAELSYDAASTSETAIAAIIEAQGFGVKSRRPGEAP